MITEGTRDWMVNQLMESLCKTQMRFSGRFLKSEAESHGDKHIVETSVSIATLQEERTIVLNEIQACLGRWIEIEDAIHSGRTGP